MFSDIDLLERLPEESRAREQLREHIDQTIIKSIKSETELRRDRSGVALALIFAASGAATSYFAVRSGGVAEAVLWMFAAAFLILGVGGFAISIEKAERDERGNQIRQRSKRSRKSR